MYAFDCLTLGGEDLRPLAAEGREVSEGLRDFIGRIGPTKTNIMAIASPFIVKASAFACSRATEGQTGRELGQQLVLL